MIKAIFGRAISTLTEAQQGCQWRDLTYELKVSKKRRSIGFRVQGQGISVTVPYGLDERLLEEALAAKYGWLQGKLEQLQQQTSAAFKLPSQLINGDHWPVFGEHLPVQIEVGKAHSVKLTPGHVYVVFTSRQSSDASRWRLWQHWYRQQALAFVEDRVDYWITQMKSRLPMLPSSISVRQYRSRWGSCSSGGELKFNYLLAMAPRQVFDYVVVHELCHLKHMHHGQQFWHMVADYCPQWQQQRQWLKQHGSGLLMELST